MLDITTVDNFIKDAIIDHVLKDLDLKLADVARFDKHTTDCFEILCIAKYEKIIGATS